MGLESAQAWAAAALAVLLICLVDSGHEHGALDYMLFLPGSHAGVVLVALPCFVLVQRALAGASRAIILLFALTVLSMFSDFLTLVQIVAPVAAAMALIGWELPQLRRRAAVIVLAMSAATLMGAGLYFALGRSGIVEEGPLTSQLMSMLDAAKTYVTTLPQLAAAIGALRVSCAFAGLAIGLALSLRAILARRTAETLPVILLSLSASAGFLGPIIVGTYSDPALFRQQLPYYTMTFIILVWALARILRGRAWLLAPATAALGLLLVTQDVALAWKKPFVLNPSFVRLADGLEQLPADLTLALYWEAKPIYLGSRRRMMVCQLAGDGNVYNWIANYGLCLEGLKRWSAGHHWLAIDTSSSENPAESGLQGLMAQYGLPDRQIDIEGRRIMLYAWSAKREARVRDIICRDGDAFRRAPPC